MADNPAVYQRDYTRGVLQRAALSVQDSVPRPTQTHVRLEARRHSADALTCSALWPTVVACHMMAGSYY